MNVKLPRTTLLLVGVAICVAACSLARAAEISVAVEPQSARKPIGGDRWGQPACFLFTSKETGKN
jgi:hypothetical protein